MSVGELNPPEENILMEDPTDEDFCLIDTNSERSALSSSNTTGGGRRRCSWFHTKRLKISLRKSCA
ncbi:hypothetical protein PC116_g22180 [Phytophthora cactorum]|nr:hypothetical protein Pcac1_g26235 [Phytophthora cactorum]KAG2805626.1 hypothetical protein PC112_g18196 [Phytophthora cactorum]KAG2850809.1 hypothetical protein PC113_g16458 [Phytophthora cactorum]KAG2885257.1 hypothetical protein PC114_g19768 [Phytophthora cactorum]KAG2910309.1 hypothetical protein PC117_g19447 [Phytophthora cactorum]